MVEISWYHGAVYIFENREAQRVKVGFTTNRIESRLNDVNDKWFQRKVTRQICGTRLINVIGLVPEHIISGSVCPGGNALPLERDTTLAESHLEKMKDSLKNLSGTEKGSIVRKINTLEKRIELYRNHNRNTGVWQFGVAYITEYAEEVEALSHEMLADRLDKLAPFGDVLSCSLPEATEAVESALSQLGLVHSVMKRTQL